MTLKIRSVLFPAIVGGVVLTIAFGLLTYSTHNKLLSETYKIVLGFTLVGILGAALFSGRV